MSKVPCGGFKLDENFFGMNENDELSLVGEKGSEGKNKSLVRSYLDGKVRWQNCPVFATVIMDAKTQKGECDIEFSLLASLIEEGVPIISNVVLNGGQGFPSFQVVSVLNSVIYDDESKPSQIVFNVVTGSTSTLTKKVIYNADGSIVMPS